MTKEQKKRVATFRFGIISEIVTSSNLEYGEKERLIQEKCARQWDIPYSCRTNISRGTIFEWVRKYTKSGNKLESLYPKKRNDTGRSRSIDDETVASIIKIKKDKPLISLESLINETVDKNPGIIARNLPDSTVYRLLKSQNMIGETARIPKDRRKKEQVIICPVAGRSTGWLHSSGIEDNCGDHRIGVCRVAASSNNRIQLTQKRSI